MTIRLEIAPAYSRARHHDLVMIVWIWLDGKCCRQQGDSIGRIPSSRPCCTSDLNPRFYCRRSLTTYSQREPRAEASASPVGRRRSGSGLFFAELPQLHLLQARRAKFFAVGSDAFGIECRVSLKLEKRPIESGRPAYARWRPEAPKSDGVTIKATATELRTLSTATTEINFPDMGDSLLVPRAGSCTCPPQQRVVVIECFWPVPIGRCSNHGKVSNRDHPNAVARRAQFGSFY
jgi:hypothetical protein